MLVVDFRIFCVSLFVPFAAFVINDHIDLGISFILLSLFISVCPNFLQLSIISLSAYKSERNEKT